MSRTLNGAQLRHLKLLNGDPQPTSFKWMTKNVHGRIIPAYGPPEEWTHIRIVTRYPGGKVAQSTLSADLHFDLLDRGFVDACAITPAGKKALTSPGGGS